MFGIDWEELLVIVIVAVVVIGPKDMPVALRTAGRWIARV
ncbi:MAG TPA: twin-arginine translocase TatA/TatE family subunit, partial [Croceibacterium sp.]|nr:twin-arginine translocase TatA/TatE family subunit [Croceibacterium sp.]